MAYSQGLYAPTDISKPVPVGVCDRSGFLFPLSQLLPQFQYRGNSLKWNGTMVADKFIDKPAEFLRPPILGPEPIVPRMPRPTNYAAQNAGGVAPLNTTQEILGD